MKTVAIMQPYLFPYIGYWQLIANVNVFVALDDVNFIKRGYINRNSILVNGEPYVFSVPVKNLSQNILIKDAILNFGEKEKKKFLRMIQMSYSKAPEFGVVYPIIEDIINYEKDNVTDFIMNSISAIKEYLGLDTILMKSSDIEKPDIIKGQERIIHICKYLNADRYINPCGGKELYSKERFEEEKMELFFLETDWNKCRYNQYKNLSVPSLSIIDVMMFNSVEDISKMLNAMTYV